MKKEFEIIYKFADVIRTIKAENKDEAKNLADIELEKENSNIKEDTYCYEIEVDE